MVIISEAVQRRFFPHESAIGRLIQSDDGPAEIVGVVGNIRRADLRDEPRADLYFPAERGPGNQTTLFVRTTSDPAGVLPSLQTALRAIEPNIAFLESRTLSDVAAASMQVTQLALWLLGLFAVISISLAAVGIYGVMSYVVRQRTREIGTRVALGATGMDIAWLVMRQGAAIAALGTVLGLAASLVASRSLAAILFGVSTSDPATLAVSAGALIAATRRGVLRPRAPRRARRSGPDARGSVARLAQEMTRSPSTVIHSLSGGRQLRQSIHAGPEHRRVPFRDERAVAESGVRTRQAGDARQLAGDGHARAGEKAAGDFAERRLAG